jgi:glycogen(starch) synthase
MNHLIISREYPPCNYSQGGIGTYVAHVARLLAERGETVHVIGERWKGAPHLREVQCDGRLIVHRVALDRPLPEGDQKGEMWALDTMRRSPFPAQAFSWQVARLAESLVDQAEIDCIEAQEFEAPLYYFLLHRALGLGPRRQPPCFVHLHSAMQIVSHHNDWDLGSAALLEMKRLEDYVIQASDAALCPSLYLARQAERHYGFPEGSITRIPLPKGDTPLIERTAETWEHGVITYVGRMEGRKGVFEWLDAAVAVARERPGLRFEMIGSDTLLTLSSVLSVGDALRRRIPDDLRSSITLLDGMPRPRLFERLANARVAVVPSRWENFPNACVEAMSTGLPVLASPFGGMAEMLEDGRTGWLAGSATPADLANALRRALDTPAATKAAMGRAAADAIRRLCDNTRTIAEHIEFRRALVARGPGRSRRIPLQASSVVWGLEAPALPSRERLETSTGTGARGGSGAETGGVAVVIAPGPEQLLDACRVSIAAQTVAAATVIVDSYHAIAPLLASMPGLRGVAMLDAGCRLEPRFIESMEATLASDDSIGVVCTWHDAAHPSPFATAPPPRRPYQWMRDDVGRCAVFRAEALKSVEEIFAISGGTLKPGDVALAVLLAGWSSVRYPALLSRSVYVQDVMAEALAATGRARLVALLQARFPAQLSQDAIEVLHLVQPRFTTPPPTPSEFMRMSASQKLILAGRALRDPVGAVRWAIGHGWRTVREVGASLGRVRSADKV